ncbi:hypothetical protein ACE6H2_009557 [Prunus campanulata]
MLQQLPVHVREAAADSMFYEASIRVEDPIYGCVKIVSQLQQDLFQAQSEMAKTKAQIAFCNAQQQLNQQQQNMVDGVDDNYQQDLHSESSRLGLDDHFHSLG